MDFSAFILIWTLFRKETPMVPPFACIICGVWFRTPAALDSHKTIYHPTQIKIAQITTIIDYLEPTDFALREEKGETNK